MKLNQMFPSAFLKAEDLTDGPQEFTIKGVRMSEIGQGEDKEVKPVVDFHEIEQGLALNKTNANMIAMMYSDETDDWIGRKIIVRRDMTSYAGKLMPCLRVGEPSQGAVQPMSPPPAAVANAQRPPDASDPISNVLRNKIADAARGAFGNDEWKKGVDDLLSAKFGGKKIGELTMGEGDQLLDLVENYNPFEDE